LLDSNVRALKIARFTVGGTILALGVYCASPVRYRRSWASQIMY